MIVSFGETAWDDYTYWQKTDRRMLERINQLMKDAARSPFEGIGKPEPLKNEWAGWWSRRIDREHRLIYRVDGEVLHIAQCRFHYTP